MAFRSLVLDKDVMNLKYGGIEIHCGAVQLLEVGLILAVESRSLSISVTSDNKGIRR